MNIKHLKLKIVAAILLILAITACIIFTRKPKTNKAIRWVETIGEHDPKGYNHGEIYYKVENVYYSVPFYQRNATAAPKEKYTMRYNADNPEEVEIGYWHQMFLPEELTYTVVGRVDDIVGNNFFDNRAHIAFSFQLGDKTIERSMDVPPNYKQLYPNLKKGQQYPVECFVVDTTNGLRLSTGRIVLHLEKQIHENK